MKRLVGKVAVITGSTRGLGLGIAQQFVNEGASIVISSRSGQSVDSVVKQINDVGGKAVGMAADVSDLAQVEALAAFAIKSFGKIDIWVNNAGMAGPYGATLDWSPDIFRQLVETNILGTYYGSRVALKHFLPQHSGKLINILGAG